MTTQREYRTNRDLFSTRYLEAHLPETDAWEGVTEAEIRAARDDITALWERAKETAPKRNESHLEETFVRPLFRRLGIPFEVGESTSRTRRRPDYAFFESDAAARAAADRRESGGEFYADAVAVADGRRWGRPLDTRASGEHERDFENPSYRIHASLQAVDAVQWAVLTDGKRWRLYYGPTSHRLDSYYEIDLPTVLEDGDLADFKYFYLFFRHEAFRDDGSGDCFLDTVYEESTVFARKLGAALQENVYEAVTVLAEGFLEYPDNDLTAEDLDLVHDGALLYLYRLIFVLYAEAEGRDLLATDDEIDEESYSLDRLKREVTANLDRPETAYRDWQDDLWSRLDELFALVDRGSRAQGIPADDLSIPASIGGLFHTDPDADDGDEARFLADNRVGDAHLADVIDLLTRSEQGQGGKRFVDYSLLDVRHLGSIYEEALDYRLAVADEPLGLEEGEYVAAGPDDEIAVESGAVYLSTGAGERKATGSYYTPAYVVESIVAETLSPLVEDIRADLAGRSGFEEGGFADAFAERIFDLAILDPAMGSGHFLTSAVDYLAREIVEAQERQAAQQGIETVDEEHDVRWARRQVARRCLYGVDLNPLAVELAKASLWLRTLDAGQPLASLDHHLKTGNALVGSDVEEMEAKFDAVGRSERRRRLEATANVHTARQFGLDGVPDGADERLAAAIEDDGTWESLAETDWFETAQRWAATDRYFHWKLEFPAVYYDADGDPIDGAGFDAVIGNPPWVATAGRADISANIDAGLRTYLEGTFDATEDQFDLYVAFYEQAIRLSRDGTVGIIVPDAILTREQNAPIREFVLERTDLSEIVRVGTAFEGVETGAVVLVSSGSDGRIRCADATGEQASSGAAGATGESELSALSYDRIPQDVFERQDANRFLVSLDEETRSILAKVEGRSSLSEYSTISRGEEIGKRADFLADEPLDGTRPIAPGGAVVRYGVDGDELRYVDPDDVEKREANYASPKLIFRQTSDSLVGTYEEDDLVTIKSAYNVHGRSGSTDELKHILGVLNSPVLDFYHHYKHAAYRSVFPQINQSTFESLPIAMADGPDETVVDAVEDLLALTDERTALDLEIADSLGSYDFGPSLAERPECQPAAGVAETPIAATAEAWPNLRIGTVAVDARRGPTVLTATARYKPADDAVETDRWGYTETEPIPALEFVGIDGETEVLLETFVPYAAGEAGGFANFRATATTSKSLLDRLQAMQVPRLDDVRDGLERYLDRRSRARALADQIAEAEQAIADRVCSLYGLTEEERAIIRTHWDGE